MKTTTDCNVLTLGIIAASICLLGFDAKAADFNVQNKSIVEFASLAQADGAMVVGGDFDGNSNDDIALLGGSGWGTIPVAFSMGTGVFAVTNQPNYSFSQWSQHSNAMAVSGDFNGDGKDDIALTGGRYFHGVAVAFSNGDGSFEVTNEPFQEFASLARIPGAVAIAGDFDRDGKDDVALTGGKDWDSIPIAYSHGNGTFSMTNKRIGSFASWAQIDGVMVVTGDFNGDRKADIALTGGANWGSLPVAFSKGDGTFVVKSHPVGDFASWAQMDGAVAIAGDFDGDRKDDIALTGGAFGWASMPVAFSQGNGSFSATKLNVGNIAYWAQAEGVIPVAGNFNGDRKDDIALTGGTDWYTLPVAFSEYSE